MNVVGSVIRASRLSKSKNTTTFGKYLSTVAEQTIQITFVDRDGNRAKVPGLVGKSLLDTARFHKIDLRGPCNGGGAPARVVRSDIWTDESFGEGPACYECHVQIPPQFRHLMPPLYDRDRENLKDNWEEEYQKSSSNLACQVILTKAHDGLVVLVPDPRPTEIF